VITAAAWEARRAEGCGAIAIEHARSSIVVHSRGAVFSLITAAAVLGLCAASSCGGGLKYPAPTDAEKQVAFNIWCSETYARTQKYMMEGTFEQQMDWKKMWNQAVGDAKAISGKVARRLDVSDEHALFILNTAIDERGGGDGALAACTSR
jgi:hypothetical protein